MNRIALAVATLTSVLVVTHAPTARACGGCFHPPTTQNASVITDHRMALSVSTTQTVLWDQVRYSGDPKEFAWVLPVGQGAYIELSRDEWLAALDAVTAPTISAPPLPSRCTTFSQGGGGGGIGCGASEYDSVAEDGGADAAAFDSGSGVKVISEGVVGPYETVTLRSTSGEAITTWLIANGFAIPPSTQPILDAYTTEGFDFIALRLAPNTGVQAMQPVRVVTPGADPTLPLRMVAAGIGSSVGLTLYVIAEGRYDAANFANATIDPSQVLWDPTQSRSNYTDLFAAASQNTNTWVTEYSGSPSTLASTYEAACIGKPSVPQPCATDDGGASDASTDDAQADDASADDAQADDASADAQSDDASDGDGGCVSYVNACTLFDDWTVATKSMSPYDVHVTRLRTSLASAALNVDLRLEASSSQTNVSNLFVAAGYTVADYDPCPGVPAAKEGCGCETAGENHAVVSTGLALFALASLVRRRRRAP